LLKLYGEIYLQIVSSDKYMLTHLFVKRKIHLYLFYILSIAVQLFSAYNY